ncbi:MAG: hypothetical protein ABSG44_18550 [Thermodesulfobacteriota bacterium]|jgi:hypothetical protein
MKKLIVLAMVLGLLSGCAHVSNIAQMEKKMAGWDMMVTHNSAPDGDNIKHYYFAYYGESFRYSGWYCWEFTCDKEGKILKTKEYWVGNNKALEEFKLRSMIP